MTAAKMSVRMKDKLMRNVLPVSYYADVQQSRASAFTRDPDEEPWAPSDQASGAHEAFGPLEHLHPFAAPLWRHPLEPVKAAFVRVAVLDCRRTRLQARREWARRSRRERRSERSWRRSTRIECER